MSGNAGSNKKARVPPKSDLDQISDLRSHLRSCPGVDPDGRAVRAAMEALDNERKKIERDERLRKRFASSSSSGGGGEGVGAGGDGSRGASEDDLADEWQDVSRSPSKTARVAPGAAGGGGGGAGGGGSSPPHDHELVPAPSPPPHEEASALGRDLASVAISSMAAAGTRVSSPLAAVALAVHSALGSDLLGFRCTGVPDEGGRSGGFAAPIRELPKSKFVPDGWDRSSGDEGGGGGRISIRYRKDGVGASVLRVSLVPTGDDPSVAPSVAVAFGAPESYREVEPLTFPLDRHVNVDGLSAALARDRAGAPPSLHYKALGRLMSDFSRKFDLGHVHDENGAAAAAAAAASVGVVTVASVTSSDVVSGRLPSLRAQMDGEGVADAIPPDGAAPGGPPPPAPPPGGPEAAPPAGGMPGRSPLVDDLDPHRMPGGDFAGDLAPGGIADPRLGRGGGGSLGGNLMGPDHPAFFGGGGGYDYYDDDDDLVPRGGPGPRVGGLGMQPRFDPYYPPGMGPNPGGPGRGTGGPGRGPAGGGGRGWGRGRGRGGRGGRAPPTGGDPNPDHQRPPSDLGGNMFL